MNPAFTTSAKPATSSLRDSVSSRSRSQTTARGAQNAPTRFLPSAVFTPVLPPTAASTMPSTVVGTCTTATPRSHVAATKPARSVTAPPPKPTTASVRVKSALPITCQQNAATSMRLPCFGVGDLGEQHLPVAAERRAQRLGLRRQRRRVDRRAPCARRAGSTLAERSTGCRGRP